MTVVINGTTGYSGPVGVLGDLTTTGNTILGDASTDTLNVANGNLVLNSSGNLGVGTTSPNTKLHITGNLTIENASNAPFIDFTESGDNTDIKARIQMDQVSGTSANLLFYTEGSGTLTERARIDSSGNLLLGTTSNAGGYKLEVYGDAHFGLGSENRGIYLGPNGFTASLRYNSDGSLDIAPRGGYSIKFLSETGGTERARIDSSGNLLVGSTSTAFNGLTVGKASATYVSVYGNTGNEGGLLLGGGGTANNANIIYKPSVDALQISSNSGSSYIYLATGGTERVRVTSAGNVGIGTAGPNYRLTVYSPTVDTDVLTIANNQINGDSQQHYVGLSLQDNNGSISGSGNASAIRSYSNLYSSWGTSLTFWTTGTAGNGVFERARFDSGGNFVMNNVQGNNPRIYSIGVYNVTGGAAANVVIDSSGGMYRSTSSLKYKQNVQNTSHGLADLLTLRAVVYESKNPNELGIVYGGLIAEEVHEAGLTEFVQYAEDGTPDALAYGNMVSLCIKAIQELKSELDSVKTELAALKGN